MDPRRDGKRRNMESDRTMKFFEDVGWRMPDGEEHLQQWMHTKNVRVNGRLTYQYHKYEAALQWVKQRRVAVDVGAHVGLWSWHMARDFEQLYAFEPMSQHRECWAANMSEGLQGAKTGPMLYGVALGDHADVVTVRNRTPNSSGDTGVEPAGSTLGETVPLRTLDSFDLPTVDFLKIDCEGFELFVLQGSMATLQRCRPTVIVEQKPETGMEKRYGVGTTDAVELLESLGAKRRKVLQGDYILSWD